MKKQFVAYGLAIIAIMQMSCQSTENKPGKKGSDKGGVKTIDTFSQFIPVDTANKMLGSYLNSINYTTNDSDLQSLIIDVHQLRRYIDSMAESNSITCVKIMLAHTRAYANSARANTYSGYKSNALTVIISAFDANGNYVPYNGNEVLDYAQPCPPTCPPGNAASPFILF